MFKAFTFKSLASLSLIIAVAFIGAAKPALAKKKKQPDMPGHWERSEDGGFDWVGEKSKTPVVRDHRKKIIPAAGSGGGVIVTSQPSDPIMHDHRKKKLFGMEN